MAASGALPGESNEDVKRRLAEFEDAAESDKIAFKKKSV